MARRNPGVPPIAPHPGSFPEAVHCAGRIPTGPRRHRQANAPGKHTIISYAQTSEPPRANTPTIWYQRHTTEKPQHHTSRITHKHTASISPHAEETNQLPEHARFQVPNTFSFAICTTCHSLSKIPGAPASKTCYRVAVNICGKQYPIEFAQVHNHLPDQL